MEIKCFFLSAFLLLLNSFGCSLAAAPDPGPTLQSSSNAIVVGYYTDGSSDQAGPRAPIERAGFQALLITDITIFDLSRVSILFVNESDNEMISAGLLNRLPSMEAWVRSGGRLVIHDRSAGNLSNPSPFL